MNRSQVLGKGIVPQITFLFCTVQLILCYIIVRNFIVLISILKKAFDTVWRNGLWQKVLKNGITGKFFKVVYNMYSMVKSCIIINGVQTDYFICNTGVRQGENLSPILFALFLK